MRTALYVRVSTQRQAQQQTSEQQLARLQAWCADQAWEVRDELVFRDEGVSGSTLRRPGLDALRDMVAAARCDQVLLTAPDRLARNYVHQMLLLEEFEQAGCRVAFLERPMSQDPHDQLLLQIRGAVAEYGRGRARADHGTDAPRPPAQIAGGCAPALECASLRLSFGARASS